MELLFEQLSPVGCMSYLVGAESTHEAWIVDPSLKDVDRYLALLKDRGLKLAAVIDTHAHADHLSGAARLMDITGCHYVMHEQAKPKDVTDRTSDGKELTIGNVKVKVLYTPGHTEDSMCLVFPDRILTGDTLFLDDGGAGRDDLPGGDAGAHFESLKRLAALPDNLVVYPGHEYRNRRPSSLGEQKQRNPFFKPKSRQEYISFLEELKLGPAEWMKKVLEANYLCTRDPNAAEIPQGVSACEVMGTLSSCAQSTEIAMISPAELQQRLASGSPPTLLDVRESAELVGELGHLPNVIHISVRELACRIRELDSHRHEDIVTICKMGGRAKTAAQLLKEAGFSSVTVLTGGMNSWNEAGLPVQREPVASA